MDQWLPAALQNGNFLGRMLLKLIGAAAVLSTLMGGVLMLAALLLAR
jgi:hypothetical protein